MLRQVEVHISCKGIVYLLREYDFGDISSVGQPFFPPCSFFIPCGLTARESLIQFNSIFNQTTLLEMVKPRASVRARPESCGAEDPHPGAASLASRAQLAPLLHRHTPTECHRAPAAPAGLRRAWGCRIQSQVQGWPGAQSTS